MSRYTIRLLSTLIILITPIASVDGSDGNRLLPGVFVLNETAVYRLQLPAAPKWIVGHPELDRDVWYVLLEDSRIIRITRMPGKSASLEDSGLTMPSQAELSLKRDPGGSFVLFAKEEYLGNFANRPVPFSAGRWAVVDSKGHVHIRSRENSQRISGSYLFDGRILSSPKGELLLLAEGSTLYPHGILGDSLEPRAFTIITPDAPREVKYRFSLSEDDVFETIAPIWFDLDKDGEKEIVLTRSNRSAGARLDVYSGKGKLIASSTAIGRGFRWMHLLAAGPFGPGGETEIIAVRTPHIGGILEYYRLENSRLTKTHAVPGYSTHYIGWRNLDTALAGDFDGDGTAEILLPSQDFSRIDAVKRTASGSEVIYSLPLKGSLSTNIAGFPNNGSMAAALGTSEGLLYLLFDS